MSCTFKIASALILAAAILVPAAAAQSPRPSSIEVSHADLDLSARAGAETLLRRIRSAAMKVCGERPSPRHISAKFRHAACTSGAMKSAVKVLDVPTVTALFNVQTMGTEIAAR